MLINIIRVIILKNRKNRNALFKFKFEYSKKYLFK